MERYKGIIYFSDGTTEETGSFGGAGAQQSCERDTAMRFTQRQKDAERFNWFRKPMRYDVKRID